MPGGLQVFDGSGLLFVDTNQFLGRFLGATAIGTGTGVITNDQFSTGIPWCVPVLQSQTPMNVTNGSVGMMDVNLWLSAPTYRFTGNSLTWTRAGAYPVLWTPPSCVLYYGVK